MNRFVHFVADQRRWLVLFVTAAALASGYFALINARINSDLNTLIRPSDELKWFQDNEQFKAKFPIFQQTSLVVVSGQHYPAVKQTARDISDQLRQNLGFKEVFSPASDAFMSDHRWYFLTEKQLTDYLRGVEYSFGPTLRLADETSVSSFLFTLADHLSSNRGQPLPAPLDNLVSSISKGYVTIELASDLVDPEIEVHHELIVVRGQQNLGAELPNEAIVEALQDDISQVEVAPGVTVRLSGEVVLAHEEIGAALDGIELAGLISILLLALILGIGIRSVGFILSVFAMLVTGVLFTLCLAVLVVGSFNTLSLIFLVMFFGLGVDFAVHFGLGLREAAESNDYSEALSKTYRDIGPALLLCMLTSSMAFLSFSPTAYVGLAELGLISALGMLVAFVLSMTFLPALLGFVELKSSRSAWNWPRGLVNSVSPVSVVSVFIFLAVLAVTQARHLEFDYSVLAMRDSNTEGMQTLLDLQEAGVTTDYSISVLAKDRPEAKQLTERLSHVELVGNVMGPDQIVPAQQQTKFNLVQEALIRFETIEEVVAAEQAADPESLALALEYLEEVIVFARQEDAERIKRLMMQVKAFSPERVTLIDHLMHEELNRALGDLRRAFGSGPFTLDQVPTAIRSRFVSSDNEFLLRVQPAEDLSDRDVTTRFIESVAAESPNIAGRSVVEWGVGEVVVESFFTATALAFTGIFLVLIVFFKGIVLPVLVVVPIGTSLLLTFAICHMVGLSLNMANILVVPLIIGLGVDTGIHVVHRMQRVGADELTHSSTAQAVLISALTTVGTFFSLSFSPHLGAASIGLLLTVAISILVVVTFVLLPALMKVTGQGESKIVDSE